MGAALSSEFGSHGSHGIYDTLLSCVLRNEDTAVSGALSRILRRYANEQVLIQRVTEQLYELIMKNGTHVTLGASGGNGFFGDRIRRVVVDNDFYTQIWPRFPGIKTRIVVDGMSIEVHVKTIVVLPTKKMMSSQEACGTEATIRCGRCRKVCTEQMSGKLLPGVSFFYRWRGEEGCIDLCEDHGPRLLYTSFKCVESIDVGKL